LASESSWTSNRLVTVYVPPFVSAARRRRRSGASESSPQHCESTAAERFLRVSAWFAAPSPLGPGQSAFTYDTIRDAILTCARKPTRVSLIYRTDPLGELRPTALPRSPRSRLTGHASKGEGSSSRPGRFNALTRVYISGPIYKISYHQGRKFLPKKLGVPFSLSSPTLPSHSFFSFLSPPSPLEAWPVNRELRDLGECCRPKLPQGLF